MSELTFYATTNDGCVYGSGASYATAHDAATGTTRGASDDTFYLQNTKSGSTYYPERGFLYFDTSSLPDGCTITDAVLSLYCPNYHQVDSGHSDIHVVEGVQDDPYNGGDYGDHLNKTTSGGSRSYPPVSGGYTDITLNATGKGWISKTGTTRFCLRVSGDINNSTPTGTNDIYVYSADKGTGYKPKLVVTYTEGEAKTSGDSGAGAESTSLRELVAAEAGAGSEAALAAVAVLAGDGGSGSEVGGLLKALFSQDEGVGTDSFKALTAKAGSDLRLHSNQGQVSIPHKEVTL